MCKQEYGASLNCLDFLSRGGDFWAVIEDAVLKCKNQSEVDGLLIGPIKLHNPTNREYCMGTVVFPVIYDKDHQKWWLGGSNGIHRLYKTKISYCERICRWLWQTDESYGYTRTLSEARAALETSLAGQQNKALPTVGD